MLSTIWKFETYAMLPLAFILLFGLLSGIRSLQRTCISVGRLNISFGTCRVSITFFFVLIALITFCIQLSKLDWQFSFQVNKGDTQFMDRQLSLKWRQDRNFYISLFCLSMWVVYWRSCGIISGFLVKFQEHEDQKAKLS